MSKRSLKILLLVEDNPGDARLLREMLNEQGLHQAELTQVEGLMATTGRPAGNSLFETITPRRHVCEE